MRDYDIMVTHKLSILYTNTTQLKGRMTKNQDVILSSQKVVTRELKNDALRCYTTQYPSIIEI